MASHLRKAWVRGLGSAVMAAGIAAVLWLACPVAVSAGPGTGPGGAGNARVVAQPSASASAVSRVPINALCQILGNCPSPNVVTQHNNNARTGAQLDETVLTPANVNSAHFGLRYDRHVLGSILAQPLYVRGVTTASGVKNLIFVATADDVVYAFDSDDASPDVTASVPNPEASDSWVVGGSTISPPANVPESTKWIWRTALGGRPPLASGWVPPDPHVSFQGGDLCDETVPHVVGITSTPAIDVSAGVLYVVSREQHGAPGKGHDYIHALDLGTGADLRNRQVGNTPAGPSETWVTHNGAGNATSGLVFNDACHRQRPGLLLQNGIVYLGYGTYTCDQGCPGGEPYRGWVIGFHAADFTPAGAFTNSAAYGEGGMGIWASGNGLAGSSDGSVFYETGNDTPQSGPLAALGDSFVKLSGDGTSLTAVSHYQPLEAPNYKTGDTDLGSGGPMLLPGGKLIGGGKDGRFFVLSQADLTAGVANFQAFYNTFHLQQGHAYANATNPYYNTPATHVTECQTAEMGAGVFGVADVNIDCWIDPTEYKNGESFGPNIHSGPVFWQTSATHGFVYKMSEKDYLKAFDYNPATGVVTHQPAHVAAVRPGADGMPGGFSSVSANGTTNGIVWTVAQQANSMFGYPQSAILYAHDAGTLAPLWNNGADQATLAKFTSPTIADGHVILPSVGLFQVYGLYSRIRLPNIPIYYPIWRLPPEEEIARKWSNVGGEGGFLGAAVGELRKDETGGLRRDFVRVVAGGGYGQISVPPGTVILEPMCEPDRELKAAPPVKVESSIYASPKSGAHYVMGEIRRLYLEVGGPAKLGYPITDEVPTPDGEGRMSRFERGTLFWYPGHAAQAGEPRPPVRQANEPGKAGMRMDKDYRIPLIPAPGLGQRPTRGQAATGTQMEWLGGGFQGRRDLPISHRAWDLDPGLRRDARSGGGRRRPHEHFVIRRPVLPSLPLSADT